jgi:hypothetical protein
MKAMQPAADQPASRTPFDELIQSIKQEEKDREDKQKAEELRRSKYSFSLFFFFSFLFSSSFLFSFLLFYDGPRGERA